MPGFAANLTLLYTELPFMRRFEAAARDGFEAVELLFPYDWPAAELAAQLRSHGLELLFFNATPRSRPQDRGVACLPERRAEFRDAFLRALAWADTLGCDRLHVMAGLMPPGASRAALRECYLDNLRWAAREAAACGRGVLIEPINAHDMPGFFLQRQDEAHALAAEAGEPNVHVMMDIYHCERTEGDALAQLRRHLASRRIGHVQIAGVPGRHEPSAGDAVDWPALFALLDAQGYEGWVGAEYHPRLGTAPGATSRGLGWRTMAAVSPVRG